MPNMPTSTDVKNAFGGRGTAGQAVDFAKALIEEERSGRLMRDAGPQDNCRIGFNLEATFSSADGSGAGDGDFASKWLDFGTIRFLEEPYPSSGCMRLAQTTDPSTLPNDKTGFDPTTFVTYPAEAMVLAYRSDENGNISGAKVVVMALGVPPDGYQVQVSINFFGPAVRMG